MEEEGELLQPIVLKCKAAAGAERWIGMACLTKISCPASGTRHLLTAHCAMLIWVT